MAATGFLPGALSFLCALSHLEGVAHRPTSLTQSSTAWSQQPTGKTDTGFPKPVQQSQDDLTVLISEQGLHAQASSASPNNKDPSTRIQHRLPVQGMRTRVFSETDTDSTAPNRGVHGFFRTNTGFLFPVSELHQELLQTGSHRSPSGQSGRIHERAPPTAYLVCFICMRQGGHLSPLELHAFHQHAFLPPFGNSRVLPKGLRIKT
jgi:hypothetical protein